MKQSPSRSRTLTRGPLNGWTNAVKKPGQVKAAKPYCPFFKSDLLPGSTCQGYLFWLLGGFALRPSISLQPQGSRLKWSPVDVLRAASSLMFCSASQYNCCGAHRAHGWEKWASEENLGTAIATSSSRCESSPKISYTAINRRS